MLQAADFAKVVLSGQWATKLLAGHPLTQTDAWSKAFLDFWHKYQSVNGAHPVFKDHAGELSVCIPVLLHGDEGVDTGDDLCCSYPGDQCCLLAMVLGTGCF